MKRSILVLMFLFSWVLPAAAADVSALFGPVKYDVKQRYGAENVHTGGFNAGDGTYLIRFQMGNQPIERPEFLEFTLNGEKVLRDGQYVFPVIAHIVRLKKVNTFEIVLKDNRPSGFKRPPLPPRFVVMTVVPYSGKIPYGAFGVNTNEDLNELSTLLDKIANPASVPLAVGSLDLRNDEAARAEAMRKLSAIKDMSTLPFVTAVFNSVMNNSEVRGEAALALGLLGDKSSIPLLMNGVLDADERPRMGAARALSFYNEEDTREPLIKMLERLDTMRRDAVINAIVNAGWKPVSALLTLAESQDPHVSRNAVGILGTTRDPRAVELLLKLLADPGPRDVSAVIAALGDTRDQRAVEPLLTIAKDAKRRYGKEAKLGNALADLGDQRAADVILDMSTKVETRSDRVQLQQAYKRLTSKDAK